MLRPKRRPRRPSPPCKTSAMEAAWLDGCTECGLPTSYPLPPAPAKRVTAVVATAAATCSVHTTALMCAPTPLASSTSISSPPNGAALDTRRWPVAPSEVGGLAGGASALTASDARAGHVECCLVGLRLILYIRTVQQLAAPSPSGCVPTRFRRSQPSTRRPAAAGAGRIGVAGRRTRASNACAG